MMRFLCLFVTLTSFVASAADRLLQEESSATTLFDVIQGSSNLRTLASALEAANLVTAIESTDPLTVFAPSNSALALIPDDYISTLLENPGFILHLTSLLLFHVTNGEYTTTDLTNGLVLEMLNGDSVSVSNENGLITLDSGTGSSIVTFSDQLATNGILHSLSSALLPEFAVTDILGATSVFFRELIVTAGLEEDLRNGQWTVLEPDVGAFVALSSDILEDSERMKEILEYHILPSVQPSSLLSSGTYATKSGVPIQVINDNGSLSFDGVLASEIDVLARNGIIHRIGTVLIPLEDAPTLSPVAPTPFPTASPVTGPPGSTPSPVDSPSTPAPTSSDPSIADLLKENSVSTAEDLITRAGLYDALKGPDSYTVFAPNNAAFESLGQSGLLDRLLEPQWIDHLREVLLLHVTTDVLYSANVTGDTTLTMLNGEDVTVRIGSSDTMFVQGPDLVEVAVTQGDQTARNGVLHEIDSVLLPSYTRNDLMDTLADNGFSTFVSLIEQAGLEDTVRSGVYTVLAPADEYFEGLNLGPSDLENLVKYHLITEVVPTELLQDDLYETATGQGVLGTFSGTFNGVLAGPTLLASNGLVYPLDGVLTPTDATDFPTKAPTPVPTKAPTQPNPSQPSLAGPQPQVPRADSGAWPRNTYTAAVGVLVSVWAVLF